MAKKNGHYRRTAVKRSPYQLELEQLTQQALESLKTFSEKEIEAGFVTSARIKRRKSMDATEHQSELYKWIAKKGFVARETTLAMHWGMLGGLLCRGLVVEVTENGVSGIRAR